MKTYKVIILLVISFIVLQGCQADMTGKIGDFRFEEEGIINEIIVDSNDQKINVKVERGTDLTDLTPIFELSPDYNIEPESGLSQDFTEPVIYTLYRNGESWDWKINVEIIEESVELEVMEANEVRDGEHADEVNYELDQLSLREIPHNPGFTRRVYIKFEIPEEISSINSAQLNINAWVGGNDPEHKGDFSIYGVDDNSWSENDLTWNNAPEDNGILVAEFFLDQDSSQAQSIELPADYINDQLQSTDDNLISFQIRGIMPQNSFMHGRVGDNPPQLVINY